ncbi:restriction endonuclease [Streptomyces fagopyri]|uniref:nSTAND3 domain-containing NTPase n=1 Tax=Streptomyces fagopyri TaxID=2662397 RepID=UPI00371A5062
MDSFDLHKLTDFDFESLCKDVLEAALGVRLEIFTKGPDRGIDLRYMSDDGSAIVVQCKHWIGTDRSTFIHRMKKDELPKVSKLKPTRYIVAASVPMNPQAKEKLQDDFSPFIRSPMDIWGLNDIVSFIKGRPDIIRRHIRLWLNDATMLESALSRNVLWRSEHFAEEVQEALKTYVPNDNFRQALGILEDIHVCVISGLPGVGKTTLAQIMAANYADQGYELIHISEDIEDAYRLWIKNGRQVFIYDDFLGQSTLGDKLHKNEDQRLISIMRRVKGDPFKRLICTTRGYILEQARQKYERLHNQDFDPVTFTVSVDQYGRDVKAAILYNHVFWSKWPPETKVTFSRPESYEPIIDHPNFNPRIISATLAANFDHRLGGPASQLVGNLNDPGLVWRHVYELQISQNERDLLTTFLSMRNFRISTLELILLTRPGWTRSQVRRSIQVVDGTFLSVRDDHVTFHNPSAMEFVAAEVMADPSIVREILSHAYAFEQVENLWYQYKQRMEGREFDGFVSDSFTDSLVEAILRCLDSDTEPYRSNLSSARVLTALEVAEFCGHPALVRRVAQMLATRGFVYRIILLENIVQVIRITQESRNPEIRAHGESVRLEGLAAILNRDRGNAAPVKAALYALELRDLLDESTLKEVNRQAIEATSSIFEAYDDGWGDVDDDDVEVALQFAETQPGNENLWPGSSTMMAEIGYEPWRGISGTGMDEEEDGWDEFDAENDQTYRLMQSLSSFALSADQEDAFPFPGRDEIP